MPLTYALLLLLGIFAVAVLYAFRKVDPSCASLEGVDMSLVHDEDMYM